MNNFLIAGNWKMNTDVNQGIELMDNILNSYNPKEGVKVLVIPPYTHINTFVSNYADSDIKTGAQNCYFEDNGAYTGEISPLALKSIGCEYVLSGHSERRTIFGETDEIINKKVQAIFKNNMTPILCIGETLDERNKGITNDILENQIRKGLKDLNEAQLKEIVIAYEPVWAIGTGVSATEEQAGEAHDFIRNYLVENYGEFMNNIYLLYGGSMKPGNAEQLLKLPNVNGGLIGGASLKHQDFASIINIAQNL